ncbi:MAG: ATP-binding protein [Nanoarchaeota archaeon]
MDLEEKIKKLEEENQKLSKENNKLKLDLKLNEKINEDKYLSIIKDITNKKELEKKLKKQKKQYLTILKAIPHAVFEIDKEGKYLFYHKGKINYKFNEDEIIGKSIFNILPKKLAKKRFEQINKAINNDKIISYNYEQNINNQNHYLNAKIVPNSKKNKAVVLIEDKTKEKLEEKFKKDVERIISHNIKSPAASIINGLDLLLYEDTNKEDFKFIVNELKKSAFSIINTINDSYKVIKLEKNDYKLTDKLVNLKNIIDYNYNEFKNYSNNKMNLTINYNKNLSNKEMYVLGDDDLLKQMFSNLITNAYEASNENSKIKIDVDEYKKFYKIQIHNEKEIPKEIRNNFFEKYKTHGKSNGTGIGTYFSKLVTNAHKGKIYFKTSKEKGTNIIINLPKYNE